MCRLLFIKNIININEYIKNFKLQSFNFKNTPFINNNIDSDYHQDGIGFAWFKSNEWIIEKSTNMNYNFNIDYLNSKYIIGHLRNKGNCVGDVLHNNTHPFIHESYIFCHNGKIIDFLKHESLILKNINNHFKNEIKGQTDSEHIFYLLLTFLQIYNNFENSIKKLHEFFGENNILYYGNFIIANDQYVCITRLTNTNNEPCSLYIDEEKLIISSEPLSNNYYLIPKSSIITIKLLNSIINFSKI